MSQEFEVTTEELLRTLQRRGIPLPSEIGAFITLEVCEQLLDRPAEVSAHDVSINEVGEVLCAPKLPAAAEADAVSALLALLGDLLVCSAPGVPNMLLDLVEHGPNEAQRSMQRLLSDLEACLLPLNRGATRRVLSRLVREAKKPGPSIRSPSPRPAAADVDAAFDALLGAEPRPRARAAAAGSQGQAHEVARAPDDAAAQRGRSAQVEPPAIAIKQAELDAVSARDASPVVFAGLPSELTRPLPRSTRRGVTQGEREEKPEAHAPPWAAVPESMDAAGAHPGADDEREDTLCRAAPSASRPEQGAAATPQVDPANADTDREPSQRRTAAAAEDARPPVRRRAVSARAKSPVDFDMMVEAQAQRGRVGLWVFGLSTAAALALLVGYFALGREQARSALGLLPQGGPQPAAAKVPAKERRVYGDLRINSQPAQAQVLLLIGKGPALATDIPLGVAQEFVALSPGYAPARALLPADAQWDELDGQSRYELAMQAKPLGESKKSESALGPTLLPQKVGTPQGRLGSVRVVTTPRGANVYQLIGFTPDVRVDNLPLDRGYDVLVYLEGRPLATRHLEPTDFREQDGKRVADVQLELPKSSR